QDRLLTRTSQMPLNELIPSLDDMVAGIKRDLGFAAGQGESSRKAEAERRERDTEDQQAMRTDRAKLNTRFEKREKETKDKGRDTLNPQFEQKKKQERATTDRWMSSELDFTAHGMRVGDVNGDGRQEILLLQDHAVKAFIKRKGRLEHLATHKLGSRTRALNMNLASAEEDGTRPIVISAVFNKEPRSKVLEFRNEHFAVRAQNIKLFLNAVRIPPEYNLRIVGQKLKAPGIFANGVSLVSRQSGSYVLGRTLELPSAANVFNFTYLPQKENDKIIVADARNSLRVYSASGELQTRTDTAYAGSEIRIERTTSLPGMGEDPNDDVPEYYYLPTRLIPCNLNADEQFELLANHGISEIPQFLANTRSFSEGEIHSLYWSGRSLSTAWQTQTIKGSVRDYGLGDMDNDGTLELYVCLTTSSGMLSWDSKKTLLLAFPLDMPNSSEQAIFRP
ncbi:MAG: VCBS repeat-containing protein, partial [Desulfohalobiaceae bacterium]